MRYFTLWYRAKNDTNGNPRRVFVTYRTKDHFVVAVYDEGYNDTNAITNPAHRRAYKGIAVDITVAEYKNWMYWKEVNS